MNHGDVEKVTSNKAQVKTVIYLDEHFSHRQRPKPFGRLSVSPSRSIDLGSLSGVLQSFK
jgi:hypothetical protein